MAQARRQAMVRGKNREQKREITVLDKEKNQVKPPQLRGLLLGRRSKGARRQRQRDGVVQKDGEIFGNTKSGVERPEGPFYGEGVARKRGTCKVEKRQTNLSQHRGGSTWGKLEATSIKKLGDTFPLNRSKKGGLPTQRNSKRDKGPGGHEGSKPIQQGADLNA